MMSRQNITDEIVDGLEFALACVTDRRVASHAKNIRTYDARYEAAFAAINAIVKSHAEAARVLAKKAKKDWKLESAGIKARATRTSKKKPRQR